MTRSGRSWTVVAIVVALDALALKVPTRLNAQSLEFVPHAGVVVPLGKLVQQSGASWNHRATVVFGGRLDAWLSQRAGIEVAVGYAPSGYHLVVSSGATADTTGGLFAASARVLYRVGRSERSPWHLVAGAGFVTHSGDYLTLLSGKTDLSGVVGVAGRFRVSQMVLQVTAEDYVYVAKFGGVSGAPGGTQGKLNSDLVLSLGFVMPLGPR